VPRTGMAAEPTTTPRRVHPTLPPWIRRPVVGSAVTLPGPAGAIIALGGCVAVSLWVVLAAAERRSFLSPPARREFVPWLVGPLGHRLPSLTPSTVTLRTELDVALGLLGTCWLVATWLAPRVRLEWIAAALVLCSVVFFLGPPLSLTDLFNYLHYGRMGATYGRNPYLDLPLSVPQDPAFRFSNWHHLPSPYGPFFTLVAYALAPLPLPAAYWTWKAIAALAWLGCVALVWWLAVRLDRSPQRALVFAGLNPLVLVYGLGGEHNDALMLLCAVGAVALVVRGRGLAGPGWDIGAGAAIVAGVAFKASLLPLVPLIVLGARRRPAALAGALLTAAGVADIVHGVFAGTLPATGLQDRLVTPLSAPNLAGLLAGAGGATARVISVAHVVLAMVVVAACAAVAHRRERLVGACAVVMLATVLTLAWTVPWYVWWVLPFAALCRGRTVKVATVAVTAGLALGAVPQMTQLIHSFGYYPTRTPVGRADHLEFERLLH
jgi:alpha-1,6-mannosyltransferase